MCSETNVGLLSVSQDTIRKIDRVLYRERVIDRFARLQECEQEDLLGEVVLSLVQHGSAGDLENAIRRGVRRWKSARDVIRCPQNIGRSVRVRQFHDSAELDSVTELVYCAMSEAMGE